MKLKYKCLVRIFTTRKMNWKEKKRKKNYRKKCRKYLWKCVSEERSARCTFSGHSGVDERVLWLVNHSIYRSFYTCSVISNIPFHLIPISISISRCEWCRKNIYTNRIDHGHFHFQSFRRLSSFYKRIEFQHIQPENGTPIKFPFHAHHQQHTHTHTRNAFIWWILMICVRTNV